MSRNLSAKQPAKNIGVRPPTREHIGSDGVVVVEKVNPIPNKRKMLHPDGSTYELSLATGFTIRRTAKDWSAAAFQNNTYGAQVMSEKMQKGHLPYDECPIAKGYVPAGPKDKPCTGSFSSEQCCEHIEKIAAARAKAHREKQLDQARKFETQQDKLIKYLEGQAASQVTERTSGSMPRPKDD